MKFDIGPRRKDFSVFVIDTDHESAHALSQTLKAGGYSDTKFYPTLSSGLAMATENPPHLVLLDLERVELKAVENFLMELRSFSPETLTIVMAGYKQALIGLQLIGRGLAYDWVARPLASTLEVVQKLDRGATQLYFQFESEQLREHLAESKPKPKSEARDTEGLASAVARSMKQHLTDLNVYLAKLDRSNDLDETIQTYIDALCHAASNAPVLYLKYVPSHISLLVSQVAYLPIEKFRGVGVDLRKLEPQFSPESLNRPEALVSLRSLVKEAFGVESYRAFAHIVQSETLGIFLVLADMTDAELNGEESKISVLRHGFELAFKRNFTLKEKHATETIDIATGALNRRHFQTRLEEEVSRSRRLRLPVSVISISFDRFNQMRSVFGRHEADSMLKAAVALIKKTARATDLVARLGSNDFAVILPHTDYEGGAVRAERIRRLVESTRIPLLEGSQFPSLTVSCGVSEYPSLSTDADTLLHSADDAMGEVMRNQGNKVCLATTAVGFRMDFVPREASEARDGFKGDVRGDAADEAQNI